MKSLILSGGGNKGSFGAGFLYEIFDRFRFNNLFGTSAGALNCLLLAQCYLDENKELLKDVWINRIKKNKNIFKKNYMKAAVGGHPFSFKPLRKLLGEIIDFKKIVEELNVNIYVTTVDIKSGKTVAFCSRDDMDPKKFLNAVIASSSMPPLFNPVKIGDYHLVDGGIRENVPVKSAIVNPETDSAVVVLCTPKEISEIEKKRWCRGLVDVAVRSIDIMMDEITLNDIQTIKGINEILKKAEEPEKTAWLSGKKILNIDIIFPDSPVSNDSLNFDPETIKKGFEMGREKGREFVSS